MNININAIKEKEIEQKDDAVENKFTSNQFAKNYEDCNIVGVA
jgi:hypothetical protein